MKGALIFAFNNEHTDYVSMARWSAANIHRHLDIPVCLITDKKDQDFQGFDKVISVGPVNLDQANKRYFDDYNTNVTWHNTNRVDAYKLSPWDQTLVLDADYVVASSQLRVLLNSQEDFMCHRFAYDITGLQTFDDLNWFGRNRMPMWWATVMIFRRCTVAEYVFDSMKMIRNNWSHYRDLYGINEPVYRNDYALSIALGIVSGHTWQQDSIPWPMMATLPEHSLELKTEGDKNFWIVNYRNTLNQPRFFSFMGLDFHAMGKQSLGDVIAAAE